MDFTGIMQGITPDVLGELKRRQTLQTLGGYGPFDLSQIQPNPSVDLSRVQPNKAIDLGGDLPVLANRDVLALGGTPDSARPISQSLAMRGLGPAEDIPITTTPQVVGPQVEENKYSGQVNPFAGIAQRPPVQATGLTSLGSTPGPFNAAGQVVGLGNSLGGNLAIPPVQPTDRAQQTVFGPAYDRFQQLIARGPERDVDAAGNPRHVGFGERLMHGLKAGGLAIISSGNPLMGLAGFGMGVVSPQTYHNMKYNMIERPQAFQMAKQEGELQGEQARRAVELGGLSGINPYTGQPTEQAKSREEQAKQREFYQGETIRNRQERTASLEQERREQVAKNHVMLAQSSGLPVDPNVVKGTTMEPFAGKTLPKTATPHWVQDQRGQWVDLNAPTGPRGSGVQGRVPADRNTLTPYQQHEIQRQEQIDQRQRMNDARKDLKMYNELQAKAQAANDLATKVHNLLSDRSNYRQDTDAAGKPKSDPYVRLGKEKYTAEDEDELWAKAKTASDEWKRHGEYMQQTHGGLIKFTGDKAEIDESAVKPQSAAPAAAGKSSSRKVATADDIERFARTLPEYKTNPDQARQRARAIAQKEGWQIQ